MPTPFAGGRVRSLSLPQSRRFRRLLAFAGAGFVLVLAFATGICFGAVSMSVADLLSFVGLTSNERTDPTAITILVQLRLPRVVLCGCIGAALAVAGVAYQSLFANPLAEPFIIGSASGAAFGATVAIVAVSAGWWARDMVPIPVAAFVGSFAAVGLSYLVFRFQGSDSLASLLLTGVAVGAIFNAGVWILLTWYDQNLGQIIAWLTGSLAGRGWDDLRRIAPWLVVGTLTLMLFARPLDAIAEGEATARNLGLRVRLATLSIVAAASALTAAAVSVAGIVGFVGFVAPHLARRIIGESHALVIPMSAIFGASLLMIADTIARTITAPVELPIGVLTATLGAPFLLLVAGRRTR